MAEDADYQVEPVDSEMTADEFRARFARATVPAHPGLVLFGAEGNSVCVGGSRLLSYVDIDPSALRDDSAWSYANAARPVEPINALR